MKAMYLYPQNIIFKLLMVVGYLIHKGKLANKKQILFLDHPTSQLTEGQIATIFLQTLSAVPVLRVPVSLFFFFKS
jgi:hypothetical protein